MDWQLALELIGAIGVLFNMFIDWPKFIDRVKGIRDNTTSSKSPVSSAEKEYQTTTSPNLIIAILLWIILIVSSISLINHLDGYAFEQLSFVFLFLIVVLYISLLLTRKQSWFNNLLISVGVVLVYFNAYSFFTAPGWIGLSLPINGDNNEYLVIEYYQLLTDDSFDCVSYPVHAYYYGQSSTRIRFEYDESSFSFVGGENCEPISNEKEFSEASGSFWFFLIPKFEGDPHQATKIYIINVSDNSLLSSEPLEIFIENRFYSIVTEIFPYYFIAMLIIYLISRKRKKRLTKRAAYT